MKRKILWSVGYKNRHGYGQTNIASVSKAGAARQAKKRYGKSCKVVSVRLAWAK